MKFPFALILISTGTNKGRSANRSHILGYTSNAVGHIEIHPSLGGSTNEETDIYGNEY